MSNPGDADATLVTGLADLAGYLAAGCKPASAFTIGTEHEAFGFRLHGHAPPAYAPADGTAGIEAMLRGVAADEGLTPILDASKVIGLKGNGASISLEPGGQFELSGATLADLHATKAELDDYLQALREAGRPASASRRSASTRRRGAPTCRSCRRAATRSCGTTCRRSARAAST